MNKLFQNAAFNLGFWIGVTLFVIINYLSYIKSYWASTNSQDNRIRFADAGGYSIGFPLTLYEADYGYPFHFYFVWSGLIIDILIGLVFSFVIGLIFRFVWLKSPRGA